MSCPSAQLHLFATHRRLGLTFQNGHLFSAVVAVQGGATSGRKDRRSGGEWCRFAGALPTISRVSTPSPWLNTEIASYLIAVPSGKNPPIVLDMATTVAAYGKVKTAAQRGEQMPVGWMVDRNGDPLTDPKRAAEGFLLPIGGAKGYGLSLIFGILAGTLNGAALGRDVVDFNADAKTLTNTGHLILAPDIAAFTDLEEFRAGIDEVWAQMKSSPRMAGVEEIRLPGEGQHRVTAERSAKGIPLAPALRQQLADMAATLGIDPL